MNRGFLLLCACGLGLVGLTAAGLYLQRQEDIDGFVCVALAQGALYLLGLWLVRREGGSRRGLVAILGFAAAMRLPVVLAPPYLSSDIYRYIWDGRVIAAGVNPYRYIPNDPHLRQLQDPEIFPRINRNNYARTIYPPAAEAIFYAVTRLGESLTTMKAAMVAFEIVTVALLLRLLAAASLPATRIVIYAWHPLPLWEFAGSGHIDAAAIAFVALSLWCAGRAGWLGGLALAGGTLVKFYPAVVMPAVWRRWDLALPVAFAGAVALAYLPVLGAGWHVLGFLPGYLKEEGFAAGGGAGFYLWSLAKGVLPLGGVSDVAYIAAAAVLLAALAAWVALRPIGAPAGAVLLAGLFTLLLSPHYPWYFAWLVLLACVLPATALLWLTVTSFLLYLVPVGSYLVWDRHRFLVESALYAPFLLLAAIDLWRHRRREAPRDGEHAPR